MQSLRILETLELHCGLVFSTTDDKEPALLRFYFCTFEGISTHKSLQCVKRCIKDGFGTKLALYNNAVPTAKLLLKARNCKHRVMLDNLIGQWEGPTRTSVFC